MTNCWPARPVPRPLPLTPSERAPVPGIAVGIRRAVSGPVRARAKSAASFVPAVGVDNALPLRGAAPIEVTSLRPRAVAVRDAVARSIEAVTQEAAAPRPAVDVSRARGVLPPAHPDETARPASAVGVDGALANAHRTETVVASRFGSARGVGSARYSSVHAQAEPAPLPAPALAVRQARLANPACVFDPAGRDRRQRGDVGRNRLLRTVGLPWRRQLTFRGESGRPLPVVPVPSAIGGAGADGVGLPRLGDRCRRVTQRGLPPGEQRHCEHRRDQDHPSPPHLPRVSPRFRRCGPSRLP